MSLREMVSATPFPKICKCLALAFLFVASLAIFTNVFHPRQMDFISLWAASVLAFEGHATGVYDIAVHQAVQNRVAAFGGSTSFAYPPPLLIILLPFGGLPYGVAAGLWVMASFALYLTAARTLSPGWHWQAAAFPPVLANAMIGQTAFLTGALFIAGSFNMRKRPFIGGMLFGCLIIKPQLGLLLPLAFIAGRQWRAFAGAACSALGLLLIGYLAFGMESYAAMMKLMSDYAAVAFESPLGWYKMTSIYASLRLAGASANIAWACHILVALAAAVMVWRIWSRPYEMDAKTAALATATALASPYLFSYDVILLVIPFFWLAASRHNLRLLALLWCIPLWHIAQNWGFNQTLNLMPLVPATLLILICRRLGEDRAVAGPEPAFLNGLSADRQELVTARLADSRG